MDSLFGRVIVLVVGVALAVLVVILLGLLSIQQKQQLEAKTKLTQRVERLLEEQHHAKENEKAWGKERLRYESEISNLKEAHENSERILTDAISAHTEYLATLKEKLGDQMMSESYIVQKIGFLIEKNRKLPDLERKLSDLEGRNRELEKRLENQKAIASSAEDPKEVTTGGGGQE